MRNSWAIGRWAFVFLMCASALTAAQDDKAAIPADFKIVAEFMGFGFGNWVPWKSTITGDGKAVQEPSGREKKESRLSEADLRDLLAKIKEADFFALKDRSTDVTDQSMLILSITRDKKTHKVVIYGPELLKDDKEVKRFFRVWSEVLRKVPSPNPEQKPERYKP